jgi:amino-acid N-acetyltransferase
VEVARALQAVKLVFLGMIEGVVVRNEEAPGGFDLVHQLTLEEADGLLKTRRSELAPAAVSKLDHAVRALRGGVPRVHIIDGRLEEGLLAEVFSNEGVGTLVHTNEYQAIRRATRKDARAILGLIEAGVENDELVRRSLKEIETRIDDYLVFEVDRNPAGCVALHTYPETGKAEMACVCVDPKYENQGIGARMMQYVENQARARGVKDLFCLSTQTFNYFVQKGGFRQGTPDDLPAARRERYEKSGRRSLVLTKKLS